ncbi:MAG: YggT family protein [Muribaculaceae bacterium]|nr:YggT family protein [Muribaculaceae bacterium]
MTNNMAIAGQIIYAVSSCFYVYSLFICVRCLLTWFPGLNWNNPVLKLIKEGADIYLNLFKFIPPIGPFDLSPMIAILVLYVLNLAVSKLLLFLFVITGFVR